MEPGCQAPSSENFIFATPQPGVIAITRAATQETATGQVDPSGNFTTTSAAGDVYAGTTTQTDAHGQFSSSAPCKMTVDVTWTFA